MTYPPGSGGQWQPNDPYQQQGGPGSTPFPAQQPGYQQQPDYGQQQGGYQQQGYQQGGYPQTGPQQAQYGQDQGQYGQQQYGYDPNQYGQQPQQAPKKRKGLIIGVVAAVVAVAAGAGITVWAMNRGSAVAGAQNPTAAASSLVSAIGQGDVAGLLTQLAPAERDLMTTLNTETTKELQRLEVYKKGVDPNKIQGFELKAENLQFDEAAAEKVNDHITVTKLVGGKVTVSSDMSKMPFTDEFMEAAFPRGMDAKPETKTIDIAEQVKKNKGEPIRITTVKVDDEWYPSLFYTVADYGLKDAKQDWPKTPIAAKGADNPGDAVRQLADAALKGDLTRVIELLPPDEMGVLHDVGPILVEAADAEPAPVKIVNMETETTNVEGGKKVLLKELELESDGEKIRVSKDGECYSAEVQGQKQRMCADELAQQAGGKRMSPDAKKAVGNLIKGLIANTGVVTTEVDGKWYVSPIRSVTDLGVTALKSLDPKDIKALIKMGK